MLLPYMIDDESFSSEFPSYYIIFVLFFGIITMMVVPRPQCYLMSALFMSYLTGFPLHRENREMMKSNSRQGKHREFENFGKHRENTGNLKIL